MNGHIPVLIVGAGPTGLMMACELARHGIDFRLIDKKAEGTQGTNAAAIQTRTLELFNVIGLIDRFLQKGHFCQALNFYSCGQHLLKVSLESLDSLYPFVLMLPQREIEKLLQERLLELHGHIERSTELTVFQQEEGKIKATLLRADGQTETLFCDWLIGCDGIHSTVRQKCNIPFPGDDLAEQFVVADAHMDSFLSSHEVHVFFDKGTFLAAMPFGEMQYRIAANLHLGYPRKLYTEKEVKELVQERACTNFNVESVSWISPFWIHSKITEKWRQNAVFLAGDAAHVHSPAGAQGMNTGLQDAINLAWKLALVIKDKAHPSLLDSYYTERYTVVSEIVRWTERLTKLALTENFVLRSIRDFVFKFCLPGMNYTKKLAMRITQLSLGYTKSPVIDYQNKAPFGAPQPGERALDVMIDEKTRLSDYFKNAQHNILIFAGMDNDPDELALKELQQGLVSLYPELLKIHLVLCKNNNINHSGVIVDPQGMIHQRYQAKQSSVYIVRPDNIIAFYQKGLTRTSIEKFLQKYLY